MTHSDQAEIADRAAHRREDVAALGREITPELIQTSASLSAPALHADLFDGVEVNEDLAYGPHERHILDVYSAASGAVEASRPVLVFVHGGAFVGGAKSTEGSPFYANVGAWAVQQGYVGVAITYRLAPESTWPGGAEDIGQAITWIVENIARHGGDPTRVFLIGQSAGAMHVADYVTRSETAGRHGRSLAGAMLISCLYDVGGASDKPMHRAYWGEDQTEWARMGTLDGLIEADLPLLLAVAEFDDPEFADHAARMVARWQELRGAYAPMHYLYGENHLTTVYGIGSDTDTLGPLLARFVAANSADE